jgi:hypothetical protein
MRPKTPLRVASSVMCHISPTFVKEHKQKFHYNETFFIFASLNKLTNGQTF